MTSLLQPLAADQHLRSLLAFIADNLLVVWLPLFALGWWGLDRLSRVKDDQRRNWIVAGLGAALLGWLDLTSLVILAALALFVYGLVRLNLPPRRFLYWLVMAMIGLLMIIKGNLLHLSWPSHYIPLGVSFYFFRLISFIIEYSKGHPKYKNLRLDHFCAWVFFFPTFLAGPILRYHDFNPLDRAEQAERKLFNYGKFWGALILKLLLVDHILHQIAYNEIMMVLTSYSSMLVLSAFGIVCFLHAYLDTLLYTAMSQALANYLGYTNVENFHRPLLSTNISQYWLRWHISLSSWTKDYVFFPTLIKTRKMWLATYASMFIIGIWHNPSINWVIWSLLHGTAINFYNLIKQSRAYRFLSQRKWGRAALAATGWAATMYFTSLAFVLIAFQDYKRPFILFAWSLHSLAPYRWLMDLIREFTWFQYLKQIILS
jgi:D-alanyl-lipoteichoic acid acyltransferase DltB (MBOAT superfamily)